MSTTNMIKTTRVGPIGTWACEKRGNTNARRMTTPMWKDHAKLVREDWQHQHEKSMEH